MKLPRLDKRVTIQYPVKSTNTTGEEIKTWTDLATVWASFDIAVARGYFSTDRTIDSQSVPVTIRYRRNFNPEWRLEYGNRYFQIDGIPVNPNEGNRWLILPCRELLSAEV